MRGDLRGNFCGSARLVPGERRGLFRPIARATYAGCGPCCDWRVVLLVAASPDRRCALCAVVRLHTHCDAGLGFVYRLSWRPSVAGRESSDAVHAYALAKFVRVVRAAHGSGKSARRCPKAFYGARIQPLFAGHCITCHGQNKHKAGLRLDSFEAAMRGSRRGPVIKAGDPKTSELFHRITLPPQDDDFMPAEHRRPLSADEVKLVEVWIANGASGTQSLDAIKAESSLSVNQASTAEIDFEEIDLAAVAKERSAQAPIITQIQKQLPNILAYRSRASADVVVTASWLGPKFGDAEMSALGPISDRIAAADFSNTAITDRSAGALAAMKNLRQLRLMHTTITDATIQALGSLQ